MFCPHCGAPREEAWRHCVRCGAVLPEAPQTGASESEEQGQSKGFAHRLIGSGRHERVMTAATALALLIAAIAALVLLRGGGDDRGRYLGELEAACIENSEALSLIREELGANAANAGLAVYSGAGAEIVAGWRAEVGALQEPAELGPEALELDSALADLELGLQALAEAPSEADPNAARLIDSGRTRLERVIGQLGLSGCEPPSVPTSG